MQKNIISIVSLFLAFGHFNLAHGLTNLEMSNAFSEKKVYDSQGNPLRVAKENWAGAATLVTSNPGWTNWRNVQLQAMDKWMSVVRDRADMVAGHMFNLLDPQSGLPVTWTVDMPEPTKVGADGGDYWRAWVSWVRERNLKNTAEAARLYRLTGRTIYRDWAIQQLDFYATNYLLWPIKTWRGNSRMMGHSLDEATVVTYLVDAIRLLEPDVTAQHKSDWNNKLLIPIANILASYDPGMNNIAVWHAGAIGMIGLETKNDALVDSAINGTKGINNLLLKGVTKDYIWYEGAFSYNNYVVAAMVPFFTQASLKGKDALLKTAMLTAQNMILAPTQFQFETGFLPSVGDTRGQIKAVDISAYLGSVRVLPTVAGIIQAKRVANWDSLLDPPSSSTTTTASTPPITSKVFESSRMAILKNSTWQAFVHYGQLTYAHAQAEVPSYELYAGSTKISTDQGTIDYSSPWHEQYFRRGIAHNVPLIDGEGQELDRGTWLEGFLERFNPQQPSISINQPAYQRGINVSRQIGLQGNIFDDSTRVTVANGANRRLGMMFNTDCQFDAVGTLAGLTPASAPLGTGFSYLSGVVKGSVPAKWSATLNCAGEKFDLLVTASKPHQLFRATAPATPLPNTRNAIYLEMLDREATFQFRITASSR